MMISTSNTVAVWLPMPITTILMPTSMTVPVIGTITTVGAEVATTL